MDDVTMDASVKIDETSEFKSICSRYRTSIVGLCLFMFLLSFKPSEPYLSQFLICPLNTQTDFCSQSIDQLDCSDNSCLWTELPSSTGSCVPFACNELSSSECQDSSDYCEDKSGVCRNQYCYKYFSEDEVNNDIYPWSTYAYLPFLLTLGPYAEIFSYKVAILFGISGRVVTRFLLLFGSTLTEMRIMQVTYALGTAAEDVFSAYIYYIVPSVLYTDTTSYVKASYFVACVLSGCLGDILVTQFDYSIDILMIISAISVTLGGVVGLYVIRHTQLPSSQSKLTSTLMTDSSGKNHKNLRYSSQMTTTSARLQVLKKQLMCLSLVFQDLDVSYLVVYWLFGNAVFMIMYGYEVSIYDELNGSDAWNGSVLSIMLLGGSVGAVIPSYLETGKMSVRLRNTYVLVAEVVSVLFSCLAIYLWETIATVACLTVFFMSWQFISVVTYAQLAHSLKDAQMKSESDDRPDEVKPGDLSAETTEEFVNPMRIDDLNSSGHPLNNSDYNKRLRGAPSPLDISGDAPDPPFSIAIIVIVAVCVILQIVLQAVLLSALQNSLQQAFIYINYIFIAATAIHSVVSIMRIQANN